MALKALRFVLRYVVLLFIAVYFLMAGILLATKYWFLPRVDQWRPNVELALSEALGSAVKIQQIQAQWRGLTPTFSIHGLTVADAQGREALVVPHIEAWLSWRSLTAFEPRFRYIGVDDLAFSVVHEKNGDLSVAGFPVDLSDMEDDSRSDKQEWFENDAVKMLLAQGQISLNNATVVWIDDKRGAPPLQLEKVSLSLRNRLLSHRLAGRLEIASSPGQQLEFVLNSDRLKTGLGQMLGNAVDGELYLSLSNIDPQSLAAWVDVPAIAGRYAARSWLELSQGRIGNVTLDVAAIAAASPKTSPESMGWLADQLNVRVSGPLSMVLNDPSLGHYVLGVEESNSFNPVTQPMVVRAQGERITLMPPDEVMGTLVLEKVAVRGGLRHSAQGETTVTLQDAVATTPDGTLGVKGSWRRASDETGLGHLDLKGSLSDFSLPQLHHYLPQVVGRDVLDWMQHAFTAGEVPQATFVVRGAVDNFPYATPQEGDFTIDGTVKGWAVDYAPPAVTGGLGWPAIQNVDGTLSLNRDVLSVTSQKASLYVSPDSAVDVKRIAATIHHLYSEPVLDIRAVTAAQASDYQAALRQTALADVVPSFVADLQGQGQWMLDLDLSVPLEHIENVDFKATINLNGGTLQYASLPALENVTGLAVITDEGFQSEGLTAHVLGSDLKVTGALGTPGQTLQVHGALNFQALNEHFKTPSLNQWIKGTLPIDVTFTQPNADGPYLIRADSDMTGVQLAFPEPLVNASGTALKTQFQWEVNPSQNSAGQGSLKIGNLVQLSATGRASATGSVLSSVAIGVGAEPRVMAEGMTVNIATRRLNATSWQSVFERMMKDFAATPAAARPLLPELASVRLSSQELTYDDHVLQDVQATMQIKQELYSAQFSSKQTSGTASWQLRQGRLVGSLNVRLDRLEWGDASDSAPSAQSTTQKTKVKLPDAKTLSTVPPLDLVINDLVLNGVKMGRLQIVGENDADNLRWNVEKFTVTNKNVQATATGHWSFDHNNPGIRLNADLAVTDLGEAFTALGLKDQLRRGQGTIKVQLDWQRFPWMFDFSGLSGKVQIDLTEGIFANINSGSARVLELLSLQSFGRLLDMNINRGETFGNGFPWSTIQGNLLINRGEVSTDNLLINSPVARIAFEGGLSLTQETLNLRATVRPNLDLSGTAMATGFLLNPIVGLSALVGNYLLRNPIENILSLRYEVTGPWSDPKLNEVGAIPEHATGTPATPATPASPVPNSGTNVERGNKPEVSAVPSQPNKPATTTPPKQAREVYRIELGKESGFEAGAR